MNHHLKQYVWRTRIFRGQWNSFEKYVDVEWYSKFRIRRQHLSVNRGDKSQNKSQTRKLGVVSFVTVLGSSLLRVWVLPMFLWWDVGVHRTTTCRFIHPVAGTLLQCLVFKLLLCLFHFWGLLLCVQKHHTHSLCSRSLDRCSLSFCFISWIDELITTGCSFCNLLIKCSFLLLKTVFFLIFTQSHCYHSHVYLCVCVIGLNNLNLF